MKKTTMGCALILLLLLSGANLRAEGDTGNQKLQTVCPVMERPINKEIFFDYQGRRIYFCCRSCIPVFEKSPEKFIEQLENTGVMLEKATAPESGQKPAAPHGDKSSSGCGCDCCS